MPTIPTVQISFPDLKLQPADGHKIRGYFANWWRDKSDLLHNHTADGASIYRYPLVQYKVLGRTPTIVGLGEGARLLVDMFLNLEELVIREDTYPLANKHIRSKQMEVGAAGEMINYQFISPWMALNQENFAAWQQAGPEEQQNILHAILVRNMLSFFKAADIWIDDQIIVQMDIKPVMTHFKNREMIAFKGRFSANVHLPDFIGLGKSTSRGYGVIQRV